MDWLKLDELRRKKKFSLAKEIGRSNGGLFNSVNRKTMNVADLEKVCNVLSVSPCDFFGCGEKARNVVNGPGVHYGTRSLRIM